MKWKIKRKVEKAIEILEILLKKEDFGNFNFIFIKQKLPNYFSFVHRYGSVELWNNYDDFRIYLIYINGKYYIRWYHTPHYSSAYVEDIEI